MWLFPGWFRPKWWTNVMDTNCTADEIRSALDYSLGFAGNDELIDDRSRMLISKKVSCISHVERIILIYDCCNRMFHNT